MENLETGSMSSGGFQTAPSNACQRIQGCLSSMIGRRSRTRQATNTPVIHTHFPSLNTLSDSSTSLLVNSSLHAPLEASNLASSPNQVDLPPRSFQGATLKLWIRDDFKFHKLGAVYDLHIDAIVGTAQYSTQIIKKGRRWEAPRKFVFRLDIDDLDVTFKLCNTRSGESLAMVVLPISLCVPGKLVSFPLALTSPVSQISGEILVDACLVVPGCSMYEVGSYVRVLNSKNQWESAVVEEFTDTHKICETTDGSRSRDVLVGSVKVRKSNGFRWYEPNDQLLKMKQPCEWICTKQGLELPVARIRSNDVRGTHSHPTGGTYVGRNELGEVGKIVGKITVSGEIGMENFCCHGHEVSYFAEALVICPGFVASWQKIKQGDLLPPSAVQSSLLTPARYCYVARTTSGEVGSLFVVSGEEGKTAMDEIRCHSKAGIAEGEVLVLEEAPVAYREFDLEISSLEDLRDPEYRFGDNTGGLLRAVTGKNREYHPYVQVSVSGATISGHGTSWTSRPKSCTSKAVALHEHIRLVVGHDLHNVEIKFIVLNESSRSALQGDPDFGDGCASLSERLVGNLQEVEVRRSGKVNGILKFLARELPCAQDEVVKKPLIATIPAPACLTPLNSSMLLDRLNREARDDNEYKTTLVTCLESLRSTTGGILLLVRGDRNGRRLPRAVVSGDPLHVDPSNVRCDVDRQDRFKEMLGIVSTCASPAELFTHADMEKFALFLSDTNQAKDKLDKHTKGGCIVVSKAGEIEDVVANFQFVGYCPYRFPTRNDELLEARHCIAISLTHWLEEKASRGVVFARWERGESDRGIFVLIPGCSGAPLEVFFLSAYS